MNLKAVLEGLLFVSGEEGISLERIKDVLEISEDEVIRLLSELSDDYMDDFRGIMIKKYGSKYKLVTKKEHALYYKKLINDEVSDTLNNASLETLAIVAYNEPITRVQIDEIRGVSSAYIIRKLVLKNLIKEVGRSELPGRPRLYGVTDGFLDYFGLNSVDDLPKIDVNIKEDMNTPLYESKYTE